MGWTLDWASAGGPNHGFRHGPFIEGVRFLRGATTSSTQHWRFGPTVLAEMFLLPSGQDANDDPASRGYGAAGGVLLEYAEHVRGPILLGGWHGDFAIGIAARVGLRHSDGGNHGYGIVSVEFRLPGMAGLAIPAPKQRNAPW